MTELRWFGAVTKEEIHKERFKVAPPPPNQKKNEEVEENAYDQSLVIGKGTKIRKISTPEWVIPLATLNKNPLNFQDKNEISQVRFGSGLYHPHFSSHYWVYTN